MKIATYNIQNLFHRDRSFMEAPFSKCLTNWVKEIDHLLRKLKKTNQDNDRLRELSFLLGFDNSFQLPYAVLRRKSGFLFLKGMDYSKELKAGELTDWNGWIALQNFPLEPVAIENKARLIAEVNPDIFLLQEIEDRASLEEFNSELLPKLGCQPFDESLVVQGNDKRGQEIGLLTRKGFQIESVRSHTYDTDGTGNLLFNKDFIEYEIRTKMGNTIWILAVHLKEQTENKELSDEIRRKQAQRIAEVYADLISRGKKNIAIVGTLNAVSYCYSLAPLLQQTDLKDITKHSSFNVDFDEGKDAGYYRMGAYRKGVNIKQKDYLLLSPSLFSKVERSGLNRKGVWPDKQPKWSVYPAIKQKKQAASEHPALWCSLYYF